MRFFVRWRRFRAKHQWVPASFASIVVGVLSSSGAATDSSTGISRATATFSSAGVGSSSLVGAGVIGSALSSSGTATASFDGKSFSVAALSASGVAAVSIAADLHQVISRSMLQDPVDCVLAGEQTEFKKGFAPFNALRGIFNE